MRSKVYVGLVVFGLSGCAGWTIASVQQEIASLCSEAMPLANLDPALGVYVIGSCATEEAIATLAVQSGAVAWLQNILDGLRTKAVLKTQLAR